MAFVASKRGRRASASDALGNIDENENSQIKLVDYSPEASTLGPIR